MRKADDKRAVFYRAFLAEAVKRNDAWVTCPPNSDLVTLETTPGSPWPAELKERGFSIVRDGDGQRILGHGVREIVHVNRDGSLAPLVEGSTAPTRTIDHAGIVRVVRYRFAAP
jgi:hypothetical protein